MFSAVDACFNCHWLKKKWKCVDVVNVTIG